MRPRYSEGADGWFWRHIRGDYLVKQYSEGKLRRILINCEQRELLFGCVQNKDNSENREKC